MKTEPTLWYLGSIRLLISKETKNLLWKSNISFRFGNNMYKSSDDMILKFNNCSLYVTKVSKSLTYFLSVSTNSFKTFDFESVTAAACLNSSVRSTFLKILGAKSIT